MKDELEEIVSISDISPKDLNNDELGANLFEAYRNLKLEKSNTDGYILLLLGCSMSPFRDFENYLRFNAGLNKDDVQLILKQKNSHFITYEISPRNYSFDDI